MGANSSIEWCRHTFNPWIGCTKVSDGCKFCYAEALMDKRWGKVEWGPKGTRVRTSPANWKQPIAWDAAAGKIGERHRVFCASLADVFEGRPELDEWLVDLLLLIDATPNLDWMLLTKRPENLPTLLPTSFQNYPRKNVWLGTSVEDQSCANERIPALLKVRAAIHFVSYEPAISEVRFGPWLSKHDRSRVDLVIVGGESGHGARPFETAWARSVIRETSAAGSACFIKQMGSAPFASDWEGCSVPMRLRDKKGGEWNEWSEELRVREMPEVAR